MSTESAWVDRIAKVVDHVQSHLDEELAPEELASLAGFSLHHFHRVFRGITGESVMGFVRRLRLERAAQRLRFGREPVTRVAFEAGYGSHEAFTRAFRARFGQAPSEYRRVMPAAAAIDAEVREEPLRHVLALRYVGPYEACGAAWGQMAGFAAQRRIPLDDIGLGLAYDDPDVTDADKLRYDACIPLDPDAIAALGELPPGYSARTIPGGTYAVALHHGSFETILDTYVALLGSWLPRRGVELADEPVVERYLRAPGEVAPEDQLTEVLVRLA